MTDVTIIISARDAYALDIALDKIERSEPDRFTPKDREAIETLRYYLTEGRNANVLRERLQPRFATDEGEGPPPGSPYWEA